MGSKKHRLLVKQVPRSRLAQNAVSGADELVLPENQLSPEFFDLIFDWDPEAANDEYYVTSSNFIELHSEIKKFLLRRVLWWAISVCVGMSVLAIVFR